jgi:ribosomal protein S18 acetylase RimI-like enzyme
MMTIIDADRDDLLPVVRTLFLEYAGSLDFALCFQDFDAEVAGLPGRYARPDGRLLLGLIDGQPAGCVAMRKIDHGTCEMKRLWVRPAARGLGCGRQLAEAVITAARTAGYRLMRLDTVASMSAAVSLYQSLGFVETAPYTHNPVPGAIFLALDLTPVN